MKVLRIHCGYYGSMVSRSCLTWAAAGSVDSTYTDWRRLSSGSFFPRMASSAEIKKQQTHQLQTLDSHQSPGINVSVELNSMCMLYAGNWITYTRWPRTVSGHSPFGNSAAVAVVAGWWGAVIGFSFEISRCTRFSRLTFLKIRAMRAPMIAKTTYTINKVHSKRGRRSRR